MALSSADLRSRLRNYPLEIHFNAGDDFIGLTLTEFLRKPHVGHFVIFTVITMATQANHVGRNSAGIILTLIIQGDPVVCMWFYITKQVTQLLTTDGTTIIVIVKALKPLLAGEGIG